MNSLLTLLLILDWLFMYPLDGPGVLVTDDSERILWNILSKTGRRRAEDATKMAIPHSAVVQVITGTTVYEKSSKSIEFKDVRRMMEKMMVLSVLLVSMVEARAGIL